MWPCKTLEAVVFLAALYPLIRTFGLAGRRLGRHDRVWVWLRNSHEDFKRNHSGHLHKTLSNFTIHPGAAGTGLLIAWLSLRFLLHRCHEWYLVVCSR